MMRTEVETYLAVIPAGKAGVNWNNSADGPQMGTKKKGKAIIKKLTGILLPREWDADGNIVALSLMMAGEKEYAIHGRQLVSLTPYIRQQVDAECEIHDTAPYPRITVLSCKPIQTASSANDILS